MDRNEYLEIVAAQVRCKRAVPYLKEELEDHIQDQKEAYLAQGMNPFEAEMAAVKEMGDPVETGVQLDQVHRPKMEWKVLGGALILGGIGLVIQTFILLLVYKNGYGQMWSAPYQVYVAEEVIKQAFITLAGVILMLVVCYMDYSCIFKQAEKIWIGLNVLLVLMCVFDIPLLGQLVNGTNRNAEIVVCLAVPVYGALLYSYRNQGGRGLVKSVLAFVVFLWIMTFEVSLGFIIMVGIVLGLGLIRAVRTNWFEIQSVEKKRLVKYGGLLGIGIILTFLTAKIYNGYTAFITVPEYYKNRLQLFVSGNVNDYLAEMIREFLRTGEHSTEMELLKIPMQSDYVWLVVVEAMGGAAGIFLALILGVFAYMLLRKAYKEKNKLGQYVALSCIWFLIIEVLFNIGGNFSVTPFMRSFMPFLACGKAVAAITYYYMGILLSIFRNTNVVRN